MDKVIKMDWKEIVYGGIINFLIWCFPLAIITKVLIGYYIFGCIFGLLCFIVAGPRFNLGSMLYKKLVV